MIFIKQARTSFLLVFFGLVIFQFSSCEKEPVTDKPANFVEQDFPIEYNAVLPEGKLPYPHHNPLISQSIYNQVVEDIFIINNFGLYQGGDSEESCYFHDGLDFILNNGTPIFALQAGTVKANIGGNQYYRTLVIADADNEEMAWTYTHINDFGVQVGDNVSKGQYIGRVRFGGLEHIHLNRAVLREGGSWLDFTDHLNIYSDHYFTFRDDDAPIIKTPFNYFHNNGNIPIDNGSEMDTISGEIDIVVSMRDIGQYALKDLGTNNYWGDRLAVRNVNYTIKKDGVVISSHVSFDFRKLQFAFGMDRWKKTLTMYKHRYVLEDEPDNYNMFLSHYIITNTFDDKTGEIEEEDKQNNWKTDLIVDGVPKYPNGLYEIEVTAYDTNNNSRTVSDFVFVQNE